MTRYVLQIDGMQCGMCESHINDAVRREFKVKSVNSSHSKNITEIISPEPLDEVSSMNACWMSLGSPSGLRSPSRVRMCLPSAHTAR